MTEETVYAGSLFLQGNLSQCLLSSSLQVLTPTVMTGILLVFLYHFMQILCNICNLATTFHSYSTSRRCTFGQNRK